MAHANQLAAIENETIREGIPTFRAGDTVKVHAKIIEGTKERIQIFEASSLSVTAKAAQLQPSRFVKSLTT